MKHLQSYQIYEYINSSKKACDLILRVMREFEALPPRLKVRVDKGSERYLMLHADEDNPRYKTLLDNLTREYKRYGIKLTYEITPGTYAGKPRVTILVYIKEERLRRIKPTHVVYHYAPSEHRGAIAAKGLEPRSNEKWGAALQYEPAVFVTLAGSPSFYAGSPGYDKWEIDTTKLTNKWWLDINLHIPGHEDHHVMTYEPIPSSAMRLVDNEV